MGRGHTMRRGRLHHEVENPLSVGSKRSSNVCRWARAGNKAEDVAQSTQLETDRAERKARSTTSDELKERANHRTYES